VKTGKPTLSFYTNMPTPYQVDFFDALKNYFDLHVIYFTTRESDRLWTLSATGQGYKVSVLKNGLLAKLVQKKVSSFHSSPDISKLIKEDKSSFVIVNGTYWSPNVVRAVSINHEMKKWVAYWSEPVFAVNSKLRFWLKKLMLSTVLNKTDCILAIGSRAEAGFRSYGYEKAIYQVPYNINTELFARSNLDQRKLGDMEKMYKPNGEYIFLSSGSLIERKGMDIIIQAFEEAGKKANIKLLILGDGEEKSKLVNLTKGDQRIEFIGFQEKEMIPYWFNMADSFVFATRYDGWGLVINEALAAGKPVISTRAAGAAADQLNSENSIICEPEDIAGFAKAMYLMATDNQLNEEFINKTRNISTKLSSAYNARKVYDICTNSK
jgi:glycosyltransferase involved in cell wall biosynthesis